MWQRVKCVRTATRLTNLLVGREQGELFISENELGQS